MPRVDWETLSKKSGKQQQQFLQEHLQREPITDFGSIKCGDHLVTQNNLYCHHFLCIGKDQQNRPEIIHYYGTTSGALARILPISSSKAFGHAGKISTMVLPHDDFIKDLDDLLEKKVQRIIWPEWLCRFPVERVVQRAKRREGETCYNVLENNCEHFVVWCMCDVNVSIQVKLVHLSLGSALCALLAGGVHIARQEGAQRLLVLFFKLIANFADEAADTASFFMNPTQLSKTATYAAYGITCIIEIGIAIYSIWQANRKRQQGILIKSDKEFAGNVAEIIAKSVCRAGLGIAGSVIGQFVLPIPIVGGLLGGALGAIIGHFIGVFIGWLARKGICFFTAKPEEEDSIFCNIDFPFDEEDKIEDEWEIIDAF